MPKSHRPGAEIHERLARDNPTVTDYQRSLADSHIAIGVLLEAMGRRDDALKSHRRAIEISEPLARDNPSVTDYQRRLADNPQQHGQLAQQYGHRDDAIKSTAGRWRSVNGWPATTLQSPSYQRPGNSHNNIGNLLGT